MYVHPYFSPYSEAFFMQAPIMECLKGTFMMTRPEALLRGVESRLPHNFIRFLICFVHRILAFALRMHARQSKSSDTKMWS